MARGQQCLQLQHYMIQKTMMSLGWVWLFSAVSSDLENCVFPEAALGEINPSPACSCRNTSGFSCRAEGRGTRVVKIHKELHRCWRWTRLYLPAAAPPQTNPDQHKYPLLSLLPESFIKRIIEPLLENKLEVTLPAWKGDTGQNSAAKRTRSWQTLKGAVTDVPLSSATSRVSLPVGLVPVSGLAGPGLKLFQVWLFQV